MDFVYKLGNSVKSCSLTQKCFWSCLNFLLVAESENSGGSECNTEYFLERVGEVWGLGVKEHCYLLVDWQASFLTPIICSGVGVYGLTSQWVGKCCPLLLVKTVPDWAFSPSHEFSLPFSLNSLFNNKFSSSQNPFALPFLS